MMILTGVPLGELVVVKIDHPLPSLADFTRKRSRPFRDRDRKVLATRIKPKIHDDKSVDRNS